MAEHLDLGLAILPFEPACFQHTSLPMQYVGHPLTKAIPEHKPNPHFRESHNLSPTDKILALFPGSRAKEIERNLPLMLRTAERLKTLDPTLRPVIAEPNSKPYDLMQNAHLALAKSGTVTLELALHKTPTVIQFAIKPIDVLLATKVFKINLPYYGLPNLIAQEEIFPELFGPNLTEEALLAHATRLWFDAEKRASMQKSCAKLWDILGTEDASLRAAQAILDIVDTD
jgi:lipid-A-disaccharide synthase